MQELMTSSRRLAPFVVLLLAGALGVSGHASSAADEELQPIVSSTRANRICVELCSGALGGPVCGDYCQDLIPEGLPVQLGQSNAAATDTAAGAGDGASSSTTSHGRSKTMESVCGVLCENNLGYPLCQCDVRAIAKKRDYPNFFEVCAAYCNIYNYQLRGCQSCGLYKLSTKNYLGRSLLSDDDNYLQPKYDWGAWCMEQCSGDTGGSACYCDMLPMMTNIV